ncbi:asparaginyl-tRNA synthetase [Chytriomyces sp. MP71]|nr:asparaginyl-tRNA synthetase [Chytriomyces sp. MP71]
MTYRFPVRTIKEVLSSLSSSTAGERVSVHGWVRTVRTQKQLAFVQVSDGSCANGIQAVTNPEAVKGLSTGASVRLEGTLVASPGGNQRTELKVDSVHLLGSAEPERYPLHKARLPLAHLRDNMHLRTRTRTFTAMWRMRSTALRGFHSFFEKNDFVHVNTPIITSNDCEGAGESFRPAPVPVFFGAPANLTVSSQLHLEAVNAALPRVYTMSPAFRAEKSLSTRHLAEFWMLEAEAAFITSLEDLMDLIEASIKDTTTYLTQTCAEDLAVLASLPLSTTGAINANRSKEATETLIVSLSESAPRFHRITYTEALCILQAANKQWMHPVSTWGCSLQSEHERYLADAHFQAPVFVTDYPVSQKPFYMLDSVDSSLHGGPTVACVDLLVPGIGEVVGGSLREHRMEGLERKMREKNIESAGLEWYLDLRRYGTVPHGGFGLGFERYLMAVSGMGNVRDVIPMPRWFGHCKH